MIIVKLMRNCNKGGPVRNQAYQEIESDNYTYNLFFYLLK